MIDLDKWRQRGRETFAFTIGNVVKTTASAVYIEGTEITINDRWCQNGYCYYRDATGVVHRQKDLTSS